MKHIEQLQNLLVILLAGNFSKRSLEDNKQLMIDITKFQSSLFDRSQRYGNPNYKPIPLEKDFSNVGGQLAQVIYEQLSVIDLGTLSNDQLMVLHQDYQTYCYNKYVNSDRKVWKAQSEVRCNILARAKKLESIEEKVSLLNFVTSHSNGGHPEHKEAEKILEELGEDEESVHVRVFGERPK